MAKNRVKLNDKINDKKAKKIKTEKYVSDDSKEIRRFVIILFSVIIVVLAVYGISKMLLDEPNDEYVHKTTAGVVDYDMVSVGTMLNRNYDEYYVAIYDEEDPKAVFYSTIITLYTNKDDALKVYYCNLGNYLNQKYKAEEDEETNPNATSISELSLGSLTLIKVKNGKIVDYIEDIDTIREEFEV